MLSVFTFQEFCKQLKKDGNKISYILACPVIEHKNCIDFSVTDTIFWLREEMENNDNYFPEIIDKLMYEIYIKKIEANLLGCIKGGKV